MSFFISWEFVISLIAFVLVLVAIKMFTTWISRDITDEIQQVPCSNCGKLHDIDSLKCPWCEALIKQDYDTKQCRYCKRIYDIDEEVCPSCGTPDKEIHEENYNLHQ